MALSDSGDCHGMFSLIRRIRSSVSPFRDMSERWGQGWPRARAQIFCSLLVRSIVQSIEISGWSHLKVNQYFSELGA